MALTGDQVVELAAPSADVATQSWGDLFRGIVGEGFNLLAAREFAEQQAPLPQTSRPDVALVEGTSGNNSRFSRNELIAGGVAVALFVGLLIVAVKR